MFEHDKWSSWRDAFRIIIEGRDMLKVGKATKLYDISIFAGDFNQTIVNVHHFFEVGGEGPRTVFCCCAPSNEDYWRIFAGIPDDDERLSRLLKDPMHVTFSCVGYGGPKLLQGEE
jgi:hypothetical protein